MTSSIPTESLAAHPSATLSRLQEHREALADQAARSSLPHTLSELTGPVYGHDAVRPATTT